MTAPVADAAAAVHATAASYRHGEDRPLGGYLGAMAGYAVSAGALAALVRARGRPLPERLGLADLLLVTVATHKTARSIAKDPVTSPLRAPFTTFQGRAGEAELAESPREGTARHSIGELLTCPFCLAQWIATGFTFGLVLAPRATRLAASVMAVRAGSDVLQFGYDRLQQAAT